MAKSKLAQANEKIADTVADGYKKVEDGVVRTYNKLEDQLVDPLRESVEAAKRRTKQVQLEQ